MAKPATCGLPLSNSFCTASSDLPDAAIIGANASPLRLAATSPEPAIAVSKLIGTTVPAFGEFGPVTTIIPLAPRWRAACAL